MNKKGFTLIELLAVILIISITLLIVFSSVNKIMKNNRNTKFEEYEKLMGTAAELYFEKNSNTSNVDLSTLVSDNLIKEFGEDYACIGGVSRETKTVSLNCVKNGVTVWPVSE